MFVKNKTMDVIFALCHILLVLFYAPVVSASIAIESISYKISPLPIPSGNCVLVTGKILHNTSDTFLLRIPAYSQKVDIRTFPKDMFQVREIKLEKTADPEVVNIVSPNHDQVHFQYSYCLNNPTRNVNYPIIENDFIHTVIKPFLITPENYSEKVKINMDFTGFGQDDIVASSFNVGEKQYQVNELIADFRSSVICIGKITIDHFTLDGNKISVVTNGKWPYFEQLPSSYIKGILKAQRQFWQDNHFPHYMLFLIKQNPPFVPRIFIGRHFHNAFSALLPEDPQSGPRVWYTLSHEAFHAWLGGKMKIPLPQGNLQWYFEGFNDFYGLWLAYKSHAITVKDYVEIYNDLLKEYYLSPLKTVSNEEVNKHFNIGNLYNQIAQVRSHIIAKQLHHQLSFNANNPFDLAMKAVFNQYRQQSSPYISFDVIDKVFDNHVGFELWQAAKNTLIAGKELTLSATIFEPIATLQEVDKEVPDFGFDLKQMLENGLIADVKANSHAYQAGLRDAQVVKAHNIDVKLLSAVTLNIEDKGIEKTITFTPDSTIKKIPQYVLNKGDSLEKYLKHRANFSQKTLLYAR